MYVYFCSYICFCVDKGVYVWRKNWYSGSGHVSAYCWELYNWQLCITPICLSSMTPMLKGICLLKIDIHPLQPIKSPLWYRAMLSPRNLILQFPTLLASGWTIHCDSCSFCVIELMLLIIKVDLTVIARRNLYLIFSFSLLDKV